MVAALSLRENKPVVINEAIRQLQEGRDNASGQVTLTPNASSTIVTSPNCSAHTTPVGVAIPSSVLMFPQTAHAAAEVTTTYAVAGKGVFTVFHANNAIADRTFYWRISGGN
jgi:hypothetical protein